MSGLQVMNMRSRSMESAENNKEKINLIATAAVGAMVLAVIFVGILGLGIAIGLAM